MSNNILIVDDDSEVHDLIRSMLKDTQWNAESISCGEEALVRLKNTSYDVVLTDILMPGMDGLTLLHHILAIRPDSKVVVMTAFNRPDRVAVSLREQAAGYLSKPFTRSTLLEALSNAMRWQRQPDDIEVLSDRPNWITVRPGANWKWREGSPGFSAKCPRNWTRSSARWRRSPSANC